MKQFILVMLFFITLAGYSQSIIYQQNFDGNNGSFTNTIVSQSTAVGGWLANNTAAQYVNGSNAYRHLWNWSNVTNSLNPHCSPISGRSLGMGFFNVNVPNVANQFFRTWDGTNCGIMPVTERYAHTGISTLGYTNIKLQFKWKCTGEVDGGIIYDYGSVVLSQNGVGGLGISQFGGQAGTTGLDGVMTGGIFYNASTTQSETLSLSELYNNKANFRFGFRMVVDECGGTGGGFIVDDIVVTGTCAATITSVTGGERCGTGSVALAAVGAAGGGSAITQYRWYTVATGGSAVGTTATGTWNTPSITQTTTYYVAAYNGRCESETRTAVTATVTSGPADVVITQTNFPVATDACSVQYVKLDLGATASTLNTWAPATGLYTDAALTQAYVSGTNAVSVYAAPTAAQMYMATTSNGATCTKTGAATVTVPGKRYTGTTTDWFAANNWTPSGVPGAADCVTIPTGKQVTISGDISAHAASLSLQGDAKLNVVGESTLKVENSVAVASTAEFKVHNNAALLQGDFATGNTNSGVIQLHRDSNSLFRLDYTMWSSPVAGQNLYDFSTGTLDTRFYEYDAATGHYVVIDPEENDFDPATGYLIRMPNGSDVPGYIAGDAPMVFNGVFTGKPNNGDIPVILATIGDRYTAIGNPYPSPISLEGFFGGGQNLLDEASPLYLWRKTNESANPSYATLTTTAYAENEAPGGGNEMADFYIEGNEANWMIAPGQGFIVKTAASASQGTYTFTNLMRRPAAAGGTPFFRDMQTPASRFWLDLTNSTDARSQVAVVYKEGATTGIDYSMDGRHYPSNGIALYSLAEDTNLTIQTRPAFNAEDVLPIGYIAITDGQYSISLRRFDGLFTGAQKIYLKDNLTGTIHNLKDSDYTFTSDAGTFNSRFDVIYTVPPVLGTKTPADIASSVIVYKNNGIIKVSSPNAVIDTVVVFDVRGTKLFEQNDVNSNATSLNGFTAEQQVLIITITTDKGEVSKKIVY